MRWKHLICGLVLAAAPIAGCSAGGSGASPPPKATVTVTAPASAPASGSISPPAPTGGTTTATAAPAAPTVPSPRQVVTAYYAAINRGDYRTAWELGGSRFASGYDAFVAAFAGTARDDLTITGVQGGTVWIALAAYQSDGSVRYFTGSYTVAGGRITGADVAAAGSAPASAPPAGGAILAPSGRHYRAGEFCPERYLGLSTVDDQGRTITCRVVSGGYHWQY